VIYDRCHVEILKSFLRSLSGPGLVLGTLFFAAALTPSLVPRAAHFQGLISGLSLAAGYGFGVLGVLLWNALQLPRATGRVLAWGRVVALCGCLGAAGLALSQAKGWQNTLRALMGMEPIPDVGVFTIAFVALAVFVLLLLLVRTFRGTRRAIARRLDPMLPGPVAVTSGLVVTALLFYWVGTGVILDRAMRAFDATYAELDALLEDDSPQPTDAHKPGAPGSLLDWQQLGRAGRRMVAAAPDSAQIEAMTGGPALEPLRVYVGLNSAETVEERARLALAEMQRIGAFERSTVVIATPTGTGWIDPESQPALEYLMRGDVATVAVQYSYLPSWLALLAESEYGVETSRAVFAAIYAHWRSLPKETRPRLYLHGLSLGSFNSDLSHDLYQVLGDPYDGAFWVGPPFSSRTWRHVTSQRNAGTPAWLPEYRDGATIRFTAQENRLARAAAPWGPYRIVYLQYASDAVTFFDPGSIWRRPEWLQAPLGPDVTPDFTWIPVVTFVQLTIDLVLATTTPLGHGHTYAFEHYLDGWLGLTDAPGWTPETIAGLKARFAAQRL
jgi:uncharacterized membrane protein